MDFIRISNIKNWLVDIPHVHPQSLEYIRQWKPIKKEVIEGRWGEDFNEWRYMPPALFWYVNLAKIQQGQAETKNRKMKKPRLTDLGWELSYMCLEARGFSGFKEDTEITCDRAITKFDRSRTPESNLDTARFLKPNGQFKDFREPRDYLRNRHSRPYGCPSYWNDCSDTITLGARGGGKSYYFVVGEMLHEFVCRGAREYTQESIDHPTKAEMFIGASKVEKSAESCSKLIDCMRALYTDPELGAWSKPGKPDFTPSPFYVRTSGTLDPNNRDDAYRDEFKNSMGIVEGSGTYIRHGTYTIQNHTAGAGGRYNIVVNEEVGLIENWAACHFANEATMIVDSTKFGCEHNIGTAGDMDKFEGIKKGFLNPKEHRVLAYPNLRENAPNQLTGFFLPATVTNMDFKDEHGNTNMEAALAYYVGLREERKKGNSQEALEALYINYPLVPSEMFLRKSGGIMPVAELKQRLELVEREKLYEYNARVGSLTWNQDSNYGVKFEPDVQRKLYPLDDWLSTQEPPNREGAIIIYEQPIYVQNVIPSKLYIMGHDPYSTDGQGESLGVTYVMKSNEYPNQFGHSEIVAVYAARPYEGRHIINENIEKLAAYYNLSPGCLNFENVGANIKEFFERKKKLYLLATQPETILTSKLGKPSTTTVYGYAISNKIIKTQAAKYAREWLLAERGTNTQGQIVRNLDLIIDKPLLQQLLAFEFEGNYDYAMAFFACVLLLEEKHNKYVQSTKTHYIEDVTKFFAKGFSGGDPSVKYRLQHKQRNP